MTRLNPGDKIACRVSNGIIISVYEDYFEEQQIFEIICLFGEGYYIAIPEGHFFQDTIYVTEKNYEKLGAERKFIGVRVCFINEHKVAHIHSKLDGLCCIDCNTFCAMAVPNQDDKKTFRCWNCRVYPFYK